MTSKIADEGTEAAATEPGTGETAESLAAIDQTEGNPPSNPLDELYPYAISGAVVAAGEARPIAGPSFEHDLFSGKVLVVDQDVIGFRPNTVLTLVGPAGRVSGPPKAFAPNTDKPVSLAALGPLLRADHYKLFVSNFSGHLRAAVFGVAEGASSSDVRAAGAKLVGAPVAYKLETLIAKSASPVAPGGSIEVLSPVLKTNFEPHRIRCTLPTVLDAYFDKDGEDVRISTATQVSAANTRELQTALGLPRASFPKGYCIKLRLRNGGDTPAMLVADVEGQPST